MTAFTLFIRDVFPEARLEISFARHEGEDAHISGSFRFSLSEDERESLANQIAEKGLDLLLATGFLILAGIEEP